MIVKEFIEWLKTQPQDAEVYVLEHESNVGYYCQGGQTSSIKFDLKEDHYEEGNGELLIGAVK